MKNTLLLLTIVFAFAGCKDDDVVEPDKVVWQEISHFKGRDKILLNSSATDNVLYLFGLGRITIVTDPNNSGEFTFQNWVGFGHIDVLYKPLMHPDFILTDAKDWRISIKTTRVFGFRPSFNTIDIDIQESPPIFSLYKPKYWDGAFIAANDIEQLLIPIDGGRACILASIDMYNFDQGSNVELKKIDFPHPISYFNGINDFFIVSTPGRTYRVNSSGDLLEISNIHAIKQLVNYDPDTAVIGDEFLLGVTWTGSFATSFDEGYTWNFGEDRFDIVTFQFVNIDGEILGYHERVGIIHLLIKHNEIEIKLVDTDGIGNGINSISKFKNQFVVTTFSGAFIKASSEFFTYVD